MKWQTNILILCIALLSSNLVAQEQKLYIDGRVELMPQVWLNGDKAQEKVGMEPKAYALYQFNNRLNLEYRPNDWLQLNAGLRTIASYGQQNSAINDILNEQGYRSNNFSIQDQGYLPLTMVWHSGKSGYFLSTFDRMNVKMTFGKFETTIGRQRINWGINGIWEPNDIFNTFSYLDFNYPERPGADAVHGQYYFNSTSSVELAFKMDYDRRYTLGGLYRTVIGTYDAQVMMGILNEEYFTVGGGWSGNIEGAGFNGEFTYYEPMSDNEELKQALVASLLANYNFNNGIFAQAGVLYNSLGSTNRQGENISMIPNGSMMTAMDYTKSKMQMFISASYPINPLLSADVSTLLNPFDGSFYLAPSVNYSVAENWDLFFIAQTYWGRQDTEFGDMGLQLFVRLQYSF
ncbi:hypothetical protein [Aureibacter tunicatorum]|uniref:Porin n=1 Tax=Aureibacter tunicatorum TaxID=866807 RepID=A0AAE3XLX9_9BACT|nr:hypothetical protein [Aureibacter tunicatorum]MDR6238433.1 hypothetical protein [Aureibacter tunicatorum]BDD03465.1 hypothetical protein AUTU_09480 [Aureibacter tunicatorum]